MNWQTIVIPEALRKTVVGRDNQILASEIKPVGRFPVIDQGQSFIAGYSDAEDRVIRRDLPLVIFGDHTRTIKFVDFPFILGADGTKVLKPKEELFDARFFAFALQNLNLPSRGYNRHFTLLKQRMIPRPELLEQQKIAAVLGLVQRATQQQERLVALTVELKTALMQHLFTKGLRGEPQKQTEIGPVPKSWDVQKFGDVAGFKNGINFTGAQKGDRGILTVDVLNMYGDGAAVILDKVYRVFKTVTEDYHLKEGDLLFVRSSVKREGVGWTSMFHPVNEPVTFCGFIIRARLLEPSITRPKFLTHYFRTDRARQTLVSGGAKVAITNINQGLLQNIYFPRPTPEEQDEIAEAVENIDRKIALHRAKHTAFTDLFHTLLHQLMTAKIRVNDLNLPELERAAAA
jgi:type I restriction enzyme, S subunit